MSATRVDRELLPNTFTAWFGRFPRLTEIQERAIPAILAGRDVLLASPTASGKTEAYGAPAAEIALEHGSASAAVFIVSPTRALANDLKRRLESPFDLVGLRFGRYTGEHKERLEGRLPPVVVTTPEALDSILARRPKLLGATRLVVLDEVHVLDGTPRGDQLRVLLHRHELEAGAEGDASSARGAPQRVAASATVERPEELARRYLVDPLVVSAAGARTIRARAFEGRMVSDLERHLRVLAEHGFRKVLAFCNSRSEVEEYASGLRGRTPYAERVFAHHGSLARARRERNERLFLESTSAVCFATLTLELGIDIGTVDYVLLAGVPGSVASLLQRIGRGGRRGEVTRAGYVTGSAASGHIYETMLRLGARGRLAGGAYAFRPDVLPQQALVLAGARSWVSAGELERVIPPGVAAELEASAADIAGNVLDALVERGHLERAGGARYVLCEDLEKRYERGTLHTNLAEEPGLDVVDRLTGEVLGRVLEPDEERVQIGGAERRIVRRGDRRILTDGSREASPAKFPPRGSPFVSFALAQEVLAALGIPRGEIWCVSMAGVHRIYHGLGVAGRTLLAAAIDGVHGRRTVVPERPPSPYALSSRVRLASLPGISHEDAGAFVAAHLGSLEKLTRPGPWARALPNEGRARAVREILEIDRVLEHLSAAKLCPLCQ